VPCTSAGRNGIGGAIITVAMVDRSSGAACAASRKPVITCGDAGKISMPPTISETSVRRN
jgi:hypothetical protein